MKSDDVSYYTGQNGGFSDLAYGLCMMMKAIVTIFFLLLLSSESFCLVLGLSEREWR